MNDWKPNSLLDLVFTNVPDIFCPSAEMMPPISSSDHLPVVIRSNRVRPFVNNFQATKFTVRWHYDLKDDENMKEALMLDDWEHVFQPRDDINKMWELWKKQFFKEMKSFISHFMHTPVKAKHSRSPPLFNNDIHRLVRANTASSKGRVHRD